MISMTSSAVLAFVASMMGAADDVDLTLTDDLFEVCQSGPFADFSHNYFARFHRDPGATPAADETVIDETWRICVAEGSAPLASTMADDLAGFFSEAMHLTLPVNRGSDTARPCIHLTHTHDTSQSFRIVVDSDLVEIEGNSPEALRDGVVKLVDLLGFRQAPFLTRGEQRYTPRLPLRVGVVPFGGSYREAVFMGYNAVILSPMRDTRNGSPVEFIQLSTSDAIPEWKAEQRSEVLDAMAHEADEARRYGLKCFAMLQMWKALPKDDPVFLAHPDMRGAEVYYHMDQPPWGFVACTEHPLMKQYLRETMAGIVGRLKLDGAAIIVGGEVFQHCFMRAAHVEQGHTTCDRCKQIGASAAVSNLCNLLGAAIQSVNPEGHLFAWPYSATFFWSSDRYQTEFIERINPSVALLTEIEKEETLEKTDKIHKSIWDYSIDLIGPGERAQRQIELARKHGIDVYFKSEPELAFEAPGLPQIPCQDRWWDRADALASAGVDGAWVFPFFVPYLGNTSGEIYKYAWWDPHPERDVVLSDLAARIAGRAAATELREAWRHTSKAIEFSPDMPPYFSGPYYLGPVHPMFADPDAVLPDLYTRRSPFGPLFIQEPRGDLEAFGTYYGAMRDELKRAVVCLEHAEERVSPPYRKTFDNEALPIRWFYHTARTHANFYSSCILRKRLFQGGGTLSESDLNEALERWRWVLADEKANVEAAAPLLDRDPRLAVYRPNTRLPAGQELLEAKMDLLRDELDRFLPALEKRLLGDVVEPTVGGLQPDKDVH